ncbi:hypothetical protein Agub_g11146, partial [Astrephomene gubernaculifera]
MPRAVEGHREEVLARFAPDVPHQLTPEEVLRNAREACNRSISFYEGCRQEYTRAQHARQSMCKVQFGESRWSEGDESGPSCDIENDSERAVMEWDDWDASPGPAAGPLASRRCRTNIGFGSSSANLRLMVTSAPDVIEVSKYVTAPVPTRFMLADMPSGSVAPQAADRSPSRNNRPDWLIASKLMAQTRRRRSAPTAQDFHEAAATMAEIAEDNEVPEGGCPNWVQRAARLTSERLQHSAAGRLDRRHLLHLMHNNAGPAAALAVAVGDLPTENPAKEHDDSGLTNSDSIGALQRTGGLTSVSAPLYKQSTLRAHRRSVDLSACGAPPSQSVLLNCVSRRTGPTASEGANPDNAPVRNQNEGSNHDSEGRTSSFPAISFRRNSCSFRSNLDPGLHPSGAPQLRPAALAVPRLGPSGATSPASLPHSALSSAQASPSAGGTGHGTLGSPPGTIAPQLSALGSESVSMRKTGSGCLHGRDGSGSLSLLLDRNFDEGPATPTALPPKPPLLQQQQRSQQQADSPALPPGSTSTSISGVVGASGGAGSHGEEPRLSQSRPRLLRSLCSIGSTSSNSVHSVSSTNGCLSAPLAVSSISGGSASGVMAAPLRASLSSVFQGQAGDAFSSPSLPGCASDQADCLTALVNERAQSLPSPALHLSTPFQSPYSSG